MKKIFFKKVLNKDIHQKEENESILIQNETKSLTDIDSKPSQETETKPVIPLINIINEDEKNPEICLDSKIIIQTNSNRKTGP